MKDVSTDLELKPEQHDPLEYEIASLRSHIRRLAEDNQRLSTGIPAEEAQIWANLYQMDEVERQLREIVWKQELRAKPRPAAERYLKLVWSQK